MLNSLKRQVEWLEIASKTLTEVANTPSFVDSDFQEGLNKGILLAVNRYEREIQQLKQMLEGFLVEDVVFEGSEENEAV